MLGTTLSRLRCPNKKTGKIPCLGKLSVISGNPSLPHSIVDLTEIKNGKIKCEKCSAKYLILAGVAILVENTREYLLTHVKGISAHVKDVDIPKEYLEEYLEAKAEIEIEHIEEDLEAERVNALYLMNHFLRVKTTQTHAWWKPESEKGSPLIDSLVREHWDHGPFAQIRQWVLELSVAPHIVELGCGVGGLASELRQKFKSYLGVDASFASIVLARHLILGTPRAGSLKIPGDLLNGPLTRKIELPPAPPPDGKIDFVVSDLENPALVRADWDLTIALNAIDMLERPESLPELQNSLLKQNGIAMQSCPYIWHQEVSQHLRKLLPKAVRDSAQAVEWLYEKAGFEIGKSIGHLPWLFFKHLRQLEIYSVHLFWAKKID